MFKAWEQDIRIRAVENQMEKNMENQIRTGFTLQIQGMFPRIRVQGLVGWGRIRVQGFRVEGFEG